MVTDNIAELSAKLRMPAVSLEQLREQQAAFDLIPYSEAARRSDAAGQRRLDEREHRYDVGHRQHEHDGRRVLDGTLRGLAVTAAR